MPIRVEKFPELRAIVLVFVAPLALPEDARTKLTACAAFKREVGSPVCRILDLTQSPPDINDMVACMIAEKGFEGGLYDPDVSTVIVGHSKLQQALALLNSYPNYAGANVYGLARTRQEALEIARRLAKQR